MAYNASDTPTTQTRTYIVNPKEKRTLRVIWLVVTLTALSIYLVSMPNAYNVLLHSPNWAGGYTDVLAQLGIEPTAIAAFFLAGSVMSLFIAVLFAVMVFSQRSDDWMALMVSLTVIMMGVAGNEVIHFNNTIIGGIFYGTAMSLLFSTMLLFPDGKFQPPFSRYALFFFIPLFFISSQFGSRMISGTQISSTGYTLTFLGESSAFLSVIAQIYRYRRVANATERQQSKYLIIGALGLLSFGIIFVLSQLYPPLRTPLIFPGSSQYTLASFVVLIIFVPFITFSMNVIPIAFGFAIVRYRLWNIDVVVNRGLVYTIQTVGLIILFGLDFFMLETLLRVVLGGTQDALAAAISAGFEVALFNPVRKKARQLVDRYLFNLRFDLNQLEAAQAHPDITHPGKLTGMALGDYEVLDVIGKGGMGEVYKCSKDGQTYAAKILLPEFANNSEMLTRFQREAQSGMELIEHRNIAGTYAVGEANGIHYMVMEFIDGTDLSKIMKESGKLDSETTVHIAKNICSALQAAHDHDYVHRDIKPSNIMIRNNGEAVLMDFGVMKMQDATTGITGTGAIGTIDYMAPEQITAAKAVDRRADIYALGVMLYEMLTGEKPFIGGPAQVMFAHLQQPVPDVRDKDETIPYELGEAIEKAMAKDPDDRFQSANAFAAALNT